MPDLSSILQVPLLQAVGVVFLIGLAERIGIPIVSIIKSLLKINGNGNGYQPQIDELRIHARVANEEMSDVKRDIGEIKADMSNLKENVAFIRGSLSKV